MYKVFCFFNNELGKVFIPSGRFCYEQNKKSLGNDQDDLEFLILLHEKIFETCEMINSVFGAAASASAAYTFIQCALGLFFLVGRSYDPISISINLSSIVVEIWMLCFACELVVKEVSHKF